MTASWKDLIEQLPNEIRLDGWLGPTLFTPEVRDGELITLGAFRAQLGGHECAQAIVIGSEREMQDGTGTAYAAFCVEPRTSTVHHVELDPPYRVRFVNSGIREFVASLHAFVAGWPLLTESDEPAVQTAVEELRSKLAAVDVAGVADDDAFWPTALESYT